MQLLSNRRRLHHKFDILPFFFYPLSLQYLLITYDDIKRHTHWSLQSFGKLGKKETCSFDLMFIIVSKPSIFSFIKNIFQITNSLTRYNYNNSLSQKKIYILQPVSPWILEHTCAHYEETCETNRTNSGELLLLTWLKRDVIILLPISLSVWTHRHRDIIKCTNVKARHSCAP